MVSIETSFSVDRLAHTDYYTVAFLGSIFAAHATPADDHTADDDSTATVTTVLLFGCGCCCCGGGIGGGGSICGGCGSRRVRRGSGGRTG